MNNQSKIEEHSLHKIQTLLEQGNYEESYRLCKRYLELKEGSNAYYFACLSLFGLGHIHQSEELIERHGELSNYGTSYLYLCAYLELHKGHEERSLLYWTRIVNIDPSDTFADRLIEELGNSTNAIQSQNLIPSRFHHYVPLHILNKKMNVQVETKRSNMILKESPIKKWVVALSILFVCIFCVFYFSKPLTLTLKKLVRLSGIRNESLPEIPSSGSITPEKNYVIDDNKPRFFYEDREEAILDYKKARKLILDRKPNQSRFLLGKLELSNASFEIKERAIQLREAIPRSFRDTFADRVSLDKILNEPYIYRSAELLFKGVVEKTHASVENVQRISVRVVGQESRDFLILYDYGSQSGKQELKNIQQGMVLEIFGVFHRKKGKKVIVHASFLKKYL